ncbi:scarecrow-like protein 14 [Physcomitrium patens]|uniref:Uncharacterized protein n=1 Tax=Physcomitrium patens TaxID=3218 RepID=A0A2K1JZG3_PHYPA|nr:scarecrow-like protein 9 [Physcomitrium patens]PNR46908.1 hypothetical protein PHYPA_014028 [Physcomitrium patens]|eukprot:XP_024386838.1 scarecrow-like protein 9 [Physcomitrella patens]
MLGSRKLEGPSQENSAHISPLESLLHRAWLRTHKPKLRKSITSAPPTDVSVGKRESSQASLPVLSELVSGQVSNEDGQDQLYFHKSRLDASASFISRFVLPELKCYSQKTYIPKSVSTEQWIYRLPGVRYGLSQGLKSLSGSSTGLSRNRSSTVSQVSGVTQSEVSGSDSVDSEEHTQPLASYLEGILTEENLEEENTMLCKTSAYQGIAKEISDLIGLEVPTDPDGSDVNSDRHWADVESHYTEEELRIVEKSSAYEAMTKEIAELISPPHSDVHDALSAESSNEVYVSKSDFKPTMELAARKMIEAYTCMLSKHMADMSINTDNEDSKNRVANTDGLNSSLLIYFDEDWRIYLHNLNQNFTPSSNFDFNMLLCGASLGSKTLEDNAVATTSGGSLTELLYKCALAVSQGDARNATDLLAELRLKSSNQGNPTQRMAHYCMEALVARMSKTGEQLYNVIMNSGPSDARLFKAIRLYLENCPYIKLAHFFAIKALLDACEGATRIHLVCYGICYGVEYPSFIQQLSLRGGKLPHLRMTVIDSASPGDDPASKLHETGRRLTAFAKDVNLPFEFVGLAGNWESFTARDMNLRDDDVLLVYSVGLHRLLDASVVASSPREVVLRRIRSINPKVFVMVTLNGGYNAPFFMTRVRECVKFFSAMYEGMEMCMPRDDPDRIIIEREIFGLEIMNIVACEGRTRVERAEPYRQWHNRLQRIGFTQLPLNPIVYSKITSMMSAYHKDYGVGEDNGWFLMGIRNQIIKCCSAWEAKTSVSLRPIL